MPSIARCSAGPRTAAELAGGSHSSSCALASISRVAVTVSVRTVIRRAIARASARFAAAHSSRSSGSTATAMPRAELV